MCSNQQGCVKLTNSTQSDVAKDDDDENNTANNVSAAPGEKNAREQIRDVLHGKTKITRRN